MRPQTWKQKTHYVLLALCLMLFSSGCVYMIVGGIGALGGYVVSPDTVEGIITGKDLEEVWDAATEIVGIMGIVREQNEKSGIILAKIQGTKVTVTISRISQSSLKLTIKARKAFLPKIKVAQDVYIKIVDKLEG